MPTKAWSERSARERNPKRVILRQGELEVREERGVHETRVKEVSRGDHTLQFSHGRSTSKLPRKADSASRPLPLGLRFFFFERQANRLTSKYSKSHFLAADHCIRATITCSFRTNLVSTGLTAASSRKRLPILTLSHFSKHRITQSSPVFDLSFSTAHLTPIFWN